MIVKVKYVVTYFSNNTEVKLTKELVSRSNSASFQRLVYVLS